jgi:hypothetical protein
MCAFQLCSLCPSTYPLLPFLHAFSAYDSLPGFLVFLLSTLSLVSLSIDLHLGVCVCVCVLLDCNCD